MVMLKEVMVGSRKLLGLLLRGMHVQVVARNDGQRL